MSTGAAGAVQHPLYIVLQHLSSDYGDNELYQATARALHLTCKQRQSEARATLRHLRLDRCYLCWSARRQRGYDAFRSRWDAPVAPVPMDLLAACPRVTTLTLHPRQLEVLDQDVVQQLEAAAGRLKRLEISFSPLTPDTYNAQLMGLRRLFRARSQLEDVQISLPVWGDAACWVLDPNCTNPTTASGPPLPLRSWEWTGCPGDFFMRWAERRQLSRTLRRLVLNKDSSTLSGSPPMGPVDVSGLAAATGLEELTVRRVTPSSLQCLGSSSSSLTRLELGPDYTLGHQEYNEQGLLSDATAVEAACAVTSLRHLVLTVPPTGLPNSISALQQLSRLHIRAVGSGAAGFRELPSDLGTRLPRLVWLEVTPGASSGDPCQLEAVPASLSRLSRLDLNCSRNYPGPWPHGTITLPATLAGALKELHLTSCNLATVHGLSRLTGLELLVLTKAKVIGSSLTALRPLTRLRHLAFEHTWTNDGYPDPSTFTIFGTLQHLTSITATGGSTACWQALVSAAPPPGLKQLCLAAKDNSSALAALSPWLSQATALTKLSLGGRAVSHAQEVLCLPPSLVELELGCVEWAEGHLPRGLLRLTALEVLHVRVPEGGLPTWFTKLRRLEGLGLWSADRLRQTGLHLLAALPALRALRFKDRGGWDQTVPYDHRNLAVSVWQQGSYLPGDW